MPGRFMRGSSCIPQNNVSGKFDIEYFALTEDTKEAELNRPICHMLVCPNVLPSQVLKLSLTFATLYALSRECHRMAGEAEEFSHQRPPAWGPEMERIHLSEHTSLR